MIPVRPVLLALAVLPACQLGDPGAPAAANEDAAVWPELPALDAEILAIMEQDRVPGAAACLVADGAVAWCQGYGWADVDDERPATPETGFLLASVSKAVTVTALAQAAERGHLDLDQDVDEILGFAVDHPDDPGTAITPRQLASHVSGIRDDWDTLDASYTDGADSPLELDAFLESYLSEGGSRYHASRNFTGRGPAATYEYSNVGAGVVGQVVADATGTDFPTWCEDEIFAPLGMDTAAWHLADLDPDTLAVPHEWRGGGYQEVGHYGFPDYPSGQLRAGAHDVARFLLAVATNGGDVLHPDTVAALQTVQYPVLDPDQGLGLYRWTVDGAEVWGHEGGEWGAAAEVAWWSDQSVGTVVLLNAEGDRDTLVDIERALLAHGLD